MLDFKKLLPVIVLLLGGAVVLYVWLSIDKVSNPIDTTPSSVAENTDVPQTEGFAQLVSFTDNGFEPSEPTILETERVRFINNSSKNLWVEGVRSADNPVYPESGDCGVSAFDSCKTLKPGEIWEFKFRHAGTWLFRNKLSTQQVGVMHVKEAL